MRLPISFIFILCFLLQVPAWAGSDLAGMQAQIQELTQIVQSLKNTVDTQAQEIKELKAQRQAQKPIAEPAPAGPSSKPLGLSSGRWMPEIGVVADMALKLDSPKDDEEGADRVSVREVELILGSAVDPYSRLDAALAFTEEDVVELEEGYLTRHELPWDITARVGRFRPKLGKALPVHLYNLDTVDEPLVIQRYFGTEGMSKTGADLKKVLDLPTPWTHEWVLGVLEGGNGEEGTAFGETRRRPTIYNHLENYLDVSDKTSLELGLGHAVGSRDEDAEFEVNVLSLDATLIHHLSPQQPLKFQTEFFNLNRTESFMVTEVDDGLGNISFIEDDLDGNVWGGYGLVDFRLNPQWATGFRYDQVEIVDRPVDSPENHDRGYTGYLTFHQSESARWRVQFSHFDLTRGAEDNQVLIQGTFSIGEHKHEHEHDHQHES